MFSQSLTRGEHKTQTQFRSCGGDGCSWRVSSQRRPRNGRPKLPLHVLSSFFQIPSFSPVCSSSVFSFSFKIFQTLFLPLSFYCSCFSTLFRPYAFLTVPCFVFQGISVILLYVSTLAFLLPLFFFSTFSPLPSSPFLFLSSANFLLRHVCSFVPTRRATNLQSSLNFSPSSFPRFTFELALGGSVSWGIDLGGSMSWCIIVFGPSFPKDPCVWIGRCQRPYVMPPAASVVSPNCFSLCIERCFKRRVVQTLF